jgi:ribosome assembly protein SQT1
MVTFSKHRNTAQIVVGEQQRRSAMSTAEHLTDSEDEAFPAEDAIEVIQDDDDDAMDLEFQDDDGASESSAGSDLEDVQDASIAHFASHSTLKRQPVYCVAQHPKTSLIAASGGQDDLGYIWCTATGQEIVKLTGHTDTVVAIAFSADGELVSTGGMDGKIRLWRRVKPTSALNELDEWSRWEFLTNLEGPDEVTVSSCWIFGL